MKQQPKASNNRLSRIPLFTRVMNKVRVNEDGCWIWTGYTHRGYGVITIDKRSQLAHQVVFQLYRGTIPEGVETKRVCGNRDCVSPSHTELIQHRRIDVGVPDFGPDDVWCRRRHRLEDIDVIPGNEQAGTRRGCVECERAAFKREMVAAAAAHLGLSRAQYTRKFGYGIRNAREVLALGIP